MKVKRAPKVDKVYIVVYAPPAYPLCPDIEILAVFDSKKGASGYINRNAKESDRNKRYYKIDEQEVYLA
jgi:hypothetical protein